MGAPSTSEVGAAAWGYDAAGRLTSLRDTMPAGVLSFAYARDANGSVTAENSTRYGYDPSAGAT